MLIGWNDFLLDRQLLSPLKTRTHSLSRCLSELCLKNLNRSEKERKNQVVRECSRRYAASSQREVNKKTNKKKKKSFQQQQRKLRGRFACGKRYKLCRKICLFVKEAYPTHRTARTNTFSSILLLFLLVNGKEKEGARLWFCGRTLGIDLMQLQ